jgi:hypothetical protein
MKKLTKVFFFSLFAVFQAYAGGDSGGGGGVVIINSMPVLMDFFTIVKSFDELPKVQMYPSHLESETSFLINSKNDHSIRNSNASFNKALSTLSLWSDLPMDTMSYLVESAFYGPLIWKFTDHSISAPPFYFAENLPKGSVTQVAAHYTKTMESEQVEISRETWNQMDLLSQSGLLIHEALRQVQFGFKNGYNDETLQRSAAIYSLCKPTGRLNYYLFYLLNNSPKEADKIYGPFDSFINSECKRLK